MFYLYRIVSAGLLLSVLCLFPYVVANARQVTVWESGSLEEVQKALQQGLSVNKSPKGFTPLMYAVSNPDSRVVAALVAAGEDPNAGLPNGLNPIGLVAMFGENPEIVAALAEGGANLENPNSLGYTPLMIAIDRNPNIEIVKSLLKAGANVNAQTPEGETPLMIASKGLLQRPQMITMLCEAGANINAQDNNGVNVLMKTVHMAPNMEMVKAILAQRPVVNLAAHSGHNALSLAIRIDEVALQQLLEEAGARLPERK